MRLAFEQALKSYYEGGLPIGAVMVDDRDQTSLARFIRERPELWDEDIAGRALEA